MRDLGDRNTLYRHLSGLACSVSKVFAKNCSEGVSVTYQPIRGGARRDVAILINGGLAGRLDARDDSCTYGRGDGRRGRGEGGGQRSSQREELWRAHEGPLRENFSRKVLEVSLCAEMGTKARESW